MYDVCTHCSVCYIIYEGKNSHWYSDNNFPGSVWCNTVKGNQCKTSYDYLGIIYLPYISEMIKQHP